MTDELTDDALTGAFRVWQRKKGHRFSVDDVLTAQQSCEAVSLLETKQDDPLHIDLGCGIGSVLLMVHHRLRWRAIGIEAQEISAQLALRNIDRNDLGSVQLKHADFRDFESTEQALLVTGTPPYFPPGTAIASPDSQRAYARIEYRGGVEDYLRTASRIVDPNGVIVVCGDARKPERVTATAAQLDLQIVRQLNACPREGRPWLFSVWTLRHYGASHKSMVRDEQPWPVQTWTARDAQGARTEQAHELRRYFGLAPNSREHASP